MSISFKGALGALADAGLGDPRRRRRRRPVRQRLRVPGAAVARRGSSSSWQGIPAVLQAATAIAAGMATKVLDHRGRGGRVRRPGVDRAVDPPEQRVRGAVRDVHRRRVRAGGAPPHAHVRHQARRAGDRRRGDPQQRARATPRRSTTVAGRSPPQDILDSRMVADPFHLLDCATASEGGCGHRARPAPTSRPTVRTGPSTCSGATATAVAPRTRTRPRGSSAATGAPIS